MKAVHKLIIIIALLLGSLLATKGYENTFKLWNVPTMTPYFADIRTLTHGNDSIAQGFDPMVENPSDPWGRQLNYPRVWQLLYKLGLNSSSTLLFGVTVISLFIIGIFILLQNASFKLCLFMLPALLSPATMLGVERGNIDLLMFALICMSIFTVNRHYLLSVFFLGLSFVLKLFPILGAIFFIRLPKKYFYIVLILLSVIFTTYIYLNYSDIKLIQENTPQGEKLSYGLMMLTTKAYKNDPQLGLIIQASSIFFAFSWLLWITIASYTKRKILVDYNETPYMDFFRSGASIYIGTFLIGVNWDYRLIFLLLTLPQLYRWCSDADLLMVTASRTAIVSILFSMWFLAIDHWYIDQLAKWLTFLSLSYLLVFSAMQLLLKQFSLTNKQDRGV